QVGLVHQGGRLQGLAGLLLGQLLRRQLAQLGVDQGQELFGGAGVALLDGTEEVRHRTHGRSPGGEALGKRSPGCNPPAAGVQRPADRRTSRALPVAPPSLDQQVADPRALPPPPNPGEWGQPRRRRTAGIAPSYFVFGFVSSFFRRPSSKARAAPRW